MNFETLSCEFGNGKSLIEAQLTIENVTLKNILIWLLNIIYIWEVRRKCYLIEYLQISLW